MDVLYTVLSWGSPVGLAIFFIGVGIFFWGFSHFISGAAKANEVKK